MERPYRSIEESLEFAQAEEEEDARRAHRWWEIFDEDDNFDPFED